MKTRSRRTTSFNENLIAYPTDSFDEGPISALEVLDNLPVFRAKHRRKRKSAHQIGLLKDSFTKNPSWTKEQVQELARKTGLSEAQVYKWGWDYKKKLKQEGVWETDISFDCREVLSPSPFEVNIWAIQQSYRSTVSFKAY